MADAHQTALTPDTLREAVARAMSGDPEAAEIAARLSPREVRLLLMSREGGATMVSPKEATLRTEALWDHLGSFGQRRHGLRPTHLGLRVRAILAAEAAAP